MVFCKWTPFHYRLKVAFRFIEILAERNKHQPWEEIFGNEGMRNDFNGAYLKLDISQIWELCESICIASFCYMLISSDNTQINNLNCIK